MKYAKTYQKISVIVFIIALFAQTFRNELIWADYVLDTDQYAALCVNKAMPEMNCNGQCQMVKKMKEADDQNDQTSQLQIRTADVVLYIENIFQLAPPAVEKAQKNYLDLPIIIAENFPDSQFRPPIILRSIIA